MDYICKQLKSPALLSKTLTKKANDKQLSDQGLKNNSKEQSDSRNNLGISFKSFSRWIFQLYLWDLIGLLSIYRVVLRSLQLVVYINL